MSRPMKLTHDILPSVQPHIHSWTKLYGNTPPICYIFSNLTFKTSKTKVWFSNSTGIIFLQWYGSQPQLITMEPELCREILNNKDKAYMKKQPRDVLLQEANGKWPEDYRR